MKISLFIKLSISSLGVFLICCYSNPDKNNANRIVEVNGGKVNSNFNSFPDPIDKNSNQSKVEGEKESKFGNYHYFYRNEKGKIVALFAENFLPRDDRVVVGAIRDVIKKAYKEDLDNDVRLENHLGVNKILLENKKSKFYTTLVKEDTGEVHSLIIERELK